MSDRASSAERKTVHFLVSEGAGVQNGEELDGLKVEFDSTQADSVIDEDVTHQTKETGKAACPTNDEEKAVKGETASENEDQTPVKGILKGEDNKSQSEQTAGTPQKNAVDSDDLFDTASTKTLVPTDEKTLQEANTNEDNIDEMALQLQQTIEMADETVETGAQNLNENVAAPKNETETKSTDAVVQEANVLNECKIQKAEVRKEHQAETKMEANPNEMNAQIKDENKIDNNMQSDNENAVTKCDLPIGKKNELQLESGTQQCAVEKNIPTDVENVLKPPTDAKTEDAIGAQLEAVTATASAEPSKGAAASEPKKKFKWLNFVMSKLKKGKNKEGKAENVSKKVKVEKKTAKTKKGSEEAKKSTEKAEVKEEDANQQK